MVSRMRKLRYAVKHGFWTLTNRWPRVRPEILVPEDLATLCQARRIVVPISPIPSELLLGSLTSCSRASVQKIS